jgi:hypothetical protein
MRIAKCTRRGHWFWTPVVLPGLPPKEMREKSDVWFFRGNRWRYGISMVTEADAIRYCKAMNAALEKSSDWLTHKSKYEDKWLVMDDKQGAWRHVS